MTDSGLQAEAVTFFGEHDLDRFVHVKDSAQQLLYKKPAGKPMGVRETDGKYINRPETIECVCQLQPCSASIDLPCRPLGRSVFYMWRLTGDKSWQDKGWQMFTAWMDNSLVDNGIASIADVRRRSGIKIDNMESFTLAETFKYMFLLHADPSLLSLDDYVLNTGQPALLLALCRSNDSSLTRRPSSSEQRPTRSASIRPSDLARRACGRASGAAYLPFNARLTLLLYSQALGRTLSPSVGRVGRVSLRSRDAGPALGHLQAAAEARRRQAGACRSAGRRADTARQSTRWRRARHGRRRPSRTRHAGCWCALGQEARLARRGEGQGRLGAAALMPPRPMYCVCLPTLDS